MLSLKTKELSSARDVIRSVGREIRLSFSRTWLIHTKRSLLYCNALGGLVLRALGSMVQDDTGAKLSHTGGILLANSKSLSFSILMFR
jgi:hypothetical protein